MTRLTDIQAGEKENFSVISTKPTIQRKEYFIKQSLAEMNLPSHCYHDAFRCMSITHDTYLIKYSNIIGQIIIYHGNSHFKNIDITITCEVESETDNLMLHRVLF